MTELRFTRRIREHAPEPTPQFTQAMEQALERIAREEEHPSRGGLPGGRWRRWWWRRC